MTDIGMIEGMGFHDPSGSGVELIQDDECRDCGHDHNDRGSDRLHGDVLVSGPGHADYCECPKPTMCCARCYGIPDDLCERGRCDDPRIP